MIKQQGSSIFSTRQFDSKRSLEAAQALSNSYLEIPPTDVKLGRVNHGFTVRGE